MCLYVCLSLSVCLFKRFSVCLSMSSCHFKNREILKCRCHVSCNHQQTEGNRRKSSFLG